MATHDYVIANGTGAAVRADLNNALAAIVSNNSSSSEPSTKYAYQWWADTTTGQLKLRNSANNGWVTIFELDGTMLMENGTVSAPGLAFASDLNTGFFSGGADKLNFATGGVERLEIGTSEVVFNDGGADIDFRIEGDTEGNLFFVDAGNARIGIGTSSPSVSLHVAATEPQFYIQDSNSTGNGVNATIQFRDSSNSQLSYLGFAGTSDSHLSLFNTMSGGALRFGTASTERIRIDSAGRMLLQSSAAFRSDSNLQIKGGNASSVGSIALASTATNPTSGADLGFITITDTGGNRGAIISAAADGNWTSGTSNPTRLVLSTTSTGASNPTERMRIRSDGRLLVPGVYAETTGGSANVNVQSDGLMQRSVSSIKYKKDVETLEDSYADALLSVRPVWYKSKCASDNPDWGHWGFIAEELAEIDPRLVTWKTDEISHDEEGSIVKTTCDPEPEGVQYDRFIPHLLNLIKRQQTAIETLETKVAALEAG